MEIHGGSGGRSPAASVKIEVACNSLYHAPHFVIYFWWPDVGGAILAIRGFRIKAEPRIAYKTRGDYLAAV